MYFGWIIVGIATLVYMLAIGTTFTAFGLFVIPVSEEFKLSRANMNSALILLNVGSAALAPIVGRMLDRFSAKRIMIGCAWLFGLSLVGLGLSHSLWLNALILVLSLPAALLGVATLTMSVLLARWFTAQRGRAMVLAAMGMSFAGIAVTPIVAWLIAAEGWRWALVTVGVAATVILTMLAMFVRERPGANDIEGGPAARALAAAEAARDPAAIREAPVPLKMGQVLRMSQFWLIGLSVSIAMGIAQAIAISLVPLGLDDGLSMTQAASLVSITGMAAISGKLLLSVFADRVDRVVLLSGLFALGAVMNAALFASSGFPLLVGSAVILGITTGAVAPLFYALVADRFGTVSFGTVRGLIAPIGAVSSALCVRLAGEVYDRTGGYASLFLIFLALQLLAAMLMFWNRFTRADKARVLAAAGA